MATQSPTIVLAATNPQQHYNWISAVSAALDALGIARTSDTGQVSLVGQTQIPLPASAPTGINNGNWYDNNYWSSPKVYEIRKLAAAGLPTIYIRIDYGVYCNSPYDPGIAVNSYFYPAILITIGSATDGAGNLTSFQTLASLITVGSVAGSTSSPAYTGSSSKNSGMPLISSGQVCNFASDGQNYLTISLGEQSPAFENKSILTFGIERSINSTTGQYSGDGIMGVCGQTGGNAHWFFADITNQRQWVGTTGIPSIAPPFDITSSPLIVNVFPLIGTTLKPEGAPTIALAYYSDVVASAVSFQAQLYSAAHTYVCCPRSPNSCDPYNTGTSMALRFD